MLSKFHQCSLPSGAELIMDPFFSLTSTAHYSPTPPPFTAPILTRKHHRSAAALSLKCSAGFPDKPTHSGSPSPSTSLRRPITTSTNTNTNKPLQSSPSQNPQFTKNPLKPLLNSPPATSPSSSSSSNKPLQTSVSQNVEFTKNPLKSLLNFPPATSPPPRLDNKLWLSNKLSPPPPAPPPVHEENVSNLEKESSEISGNEEMETRSEKFREKGKIFIGNLPLWVKKKEFGEFFRQFGPIKSVILIKGHHKTEMNKGFGFVIYDGPTAEKAAMKAVEFDGIEFHGRVLTVTLDDGGRMKGKMEERRRWVEGEDKVEYGSKWHKEREGSRMEFRKVLDTQPENWQAVVKAFERIEKVPRLLRYSL